MTLEMCNLSMYKCDGWRETLTSMLSMSSILDWKSSPSALACWMGWASWLYVWGQEQETHTSDMKMTQLNGTD